MSKNIDVLTGKIESQPCLCYGCGRGWGSHDLKEYIRAEGATEITNQVGDAPAGICPKCGEYAFPVRTTAAPKR